MADKTEHPNEAKSQLWARLDDARVSMLSIHGSNQHPQPMTHYVDAETGIIWFITASDTDLARATAGRVPGQMTFMAPKGDYQASLAGGLEIVDDDEKLDELWSVPAAAWFEHGRDDPKVRLLRFTPDEAAIWESDRNPVLVGAKILNAGLREGEAHPDIGTHHIIQFDAAA